MFSELPAEVVQRVGSHLSRRTLVSLSSTSSGIRQAVLPLLFNTITLPAITRTVLRNCNETLGPAILGSINYLTIRVTAHLTENTNTSVLNVEAEALCAFSNLLITLSSLKDVELAIKSDTHGTRLSLSSIHSSPNYPRMIRQLTRSAMLQNSNISFKINLRNVLLNTDEEVTALVQLLEDFTRLPIHTLILDIARASAQTSLRAETLVKLQTCGHIENVEIHASAFESIHDLALALKVTALTLDEAWHLEDWESPISSDVLTFTNLQYLQLGCFGSADIVVRIISLLQAPKLSAIHLDEIKTDSGAVILGNEFKSFLHRCALLKSVKIGLCPGRDPWLSVQTLLEDLRLYMATLGKQLGLKTDYWESNARSKTGQAVPISGPLQDYIEEIALDFNLNANTVLPMYRATRVRLPSVRGLWLELLDDQRSLGVLQWYLDGLDLPDITTLTVVIGRCPALLNPILSCLPWLPARCSIQVLHDSRWPGQTVRAKKYANSFEASAECATLKALCTSLGIQLLFKGKHWSSSTPTV